MNTLETKVVKRPLLKLSVIAIFVILLAVLSIQTAKMLPEAFSSLASLAESLQNPARSQDVGTDTITTLHVTSNQTVATSGEPVTLSWDTAKTPGSYTFAYKCTDRIAVDIIENGNTRNLDCDVSYNIGNIDTLTIAIDSEKKQFADLVYTVEFLGTNDTAPRASGSDSLAVRNDTIDTTSNNTPATTTDTTVATTHETVTKAEPAPTTKTEYVYTIPTSDPNGRTDLGVTFIGSGTIIGDTFFAEQIKQNEKGAIQFSVKNYGTKTSGDWTFSVTLPDGSTYNAPTQKPLKPNERALLTIGFSATNDPTHTFNIKVKEATDQNRINDRAVQQISFVK